MPYENRTIMSNLAKRPLKKLFVEDLKLHTVSEQYGSLLRIAAGDPGRRELRSAGREVHLPRQRLSLRYP